MTVTNVLYYVQMICLIHYRHSAVKGDHVCVVLVSATKISGGSNASAVLYFR